MTQQGIAQPARPGLKRALPGLFTGQGKGMYGNDNDGGRWR
jgi:hypothetical protein